MRLILAFRTVVRADTNICVEGSITSGIPSPTTGQNIAMGYIQSGYHKKDTKVLIEVRKKMREGVVTKMPFVPAKVR